MALGSDYDGCLVPAELKDVAGLPKLIEKFRAAGLDDRLIRKIASENWLSVLERTGI